MVTAGTGAVVVDMTGEIQGQGAEGVSQAVGSPSLLVGSSTYSSQFHMSVGWRAQWPHR